MSQINQDAGDGVTATPVDDVFANDPIPMIWRRLSNAPRRFTLPTADWNYEKLMEKLRKLDPQFDREKEEVFYTDKRGNNIFFMTTDEMEAMLEHFHRLRINTVEIESKASGKLFNTRKDVPGLSTNRRTKGAGVQVRELPPSHAPLYRPKGMESKPTPKIREKAGVRNCVSLFRLSPEKDSKQFGVTFSHGPHCQLKKGYPVDLYASGGKHVCTGTVYDHNRGKDYVLIDVTLPPGPHNPPPMYKQIIERLDRYILIGYPDVILHRDIEEQQPHVRPGYIESTDSNLRSQIRGTGGAMPGYSGGLVVDENEEEEEGEEKIVGIALNVGPTIDFDLQKEKNQLALRNPKVLANVLGMLDVEAGCAPAVYILPIHEIVNFSELASFLPQPEQKEAVEAEEAKEAKERVKRRHGGSLGESSAGKCPRGDDHQQGGNDTQPPPTTTPSPATAATTFRMKATYIQMPLPRLYEILTSTEEIYKWAGGQDGVVMDSRVGGDFSFFNGLISGRFERLVKNRELAAKFRLRDYPLGCTADVSLALAKKGSGTELLIRAEDVPNGWMKETKKVFSENYLQSITKTFRLQLLCIANR